MQYEDQLIYLHVAWTLKRKHWASQLYYCLQNRNQDGKPVAEKMLKLNFEWESVSFEVEDS